MVFELIALLEKNQGKLDLAEISRELNAQPSAVAGMIEMLVRKGRIAEIRPMCGSCDKCGLNNQCTIPTKRTKQYVIAERRRTYAPKL